MNKRGRELCEWAETVEGETLRSKVLIAFAFLALAFQYPDRPLHRIARDSLASAGNIAVGWRMRAHMFRAMHYFLFDLDRAEAELLLADQLSGSPDDLIGVAVVNSAVKLFRGDHQGAIRILKDVLASDTATGVFSSAAHGALFFAFSLAEEREDIARMLESTTVIRELWLDQVRRGEQWSLTNEVGRIVALGYLGEMNRARRDLIVAASLLNGERLIGIDGDLLTAAAMLCLYDNDLQRASVLLRAVNATRTHATICVYMEAYDRIHGRPDGDLAAARMAVMHQRLGQRDPASARQARATLETEIARLTALISTTT